MPIAELHEEIEKAAREMQEWQAAGLGAESKQEWLRTFRAAEAALSHGQELDQRYNRARKQVVGVFEGIDASLERSVDRLWGKVADALRVKLTEAVVPGGPDSRAILAAFADTAAQRGGARTVREATDRLLDLPTEYGSIFLRVGRPIIRKIEWDRNEESQLGQKLAAAAAGGLAGAGVSAAAGPVLGATAAHSPAARPAGPSQRPPARECAGPPRRPRRGASGLGTSPRKAPRRLRRVRARTSRDSKKVT